MMISVALFLLSFSRKSKKARLRLFQASSIMLAITLLEVVALLHHRVFIQNAADAPRYNYGRTQYWVEDDELGYRPRPSILNRARKGVNNKTVYDTEYTIDSHGLRKTRSNATAQCSFLFFGGSTAFGEGLPDTHTLPSQFTESANT